MAITLDGAGPVTPLEPPAPYIGGKKHLAETVTARIEAITHECYVEPFLGMGGVFFRRRWRPVREVVNDISRDVVTLFRVLQRHPQALADELAFALPARAEFERLMAVEPDTLTDVERAARFFYLQRLAYGGKVAGRTFGVSIVSRPSNFRALQRRLARIHARLAGVIIECLPYRELIARYDSPETLFYLDPPYWGSEGDYGRGVFNRTDFSRLAELLAGLKGRWLLSINDTAEVHEIFTGFPLEEVVTRYSIGADERGRTRRELILSDRPASEDRAPLFR